VRSGSRRRAALAGGLALGFVLAGCAAESLPAPPMPPDLRVVAPPPSVSRENARFAGRWTGKWEEQLDHVLVVELVVQNEQAAEVVAVYSWGVSADTSAKPSVETPGYFQTPVSRSVAICVTNR